ncbi:NAD-dependent epimerase/dehydratase family protein [Kocuria tytonis]|uniref:NAD-dependent epimerase/dehydratase family protein n=1 Tax=Kocuria tytonis TaxID=2054280 RepID=A0A495ACW3_9MICC|nr:NAD-dependent epimerase/dehydratase family protein [Kocuria tytonis]RKQ36595.1 NAD-dependent epimerase/dehydratase family protein [Kocuria tytonis]
MSDDPTVSPRRSARDGRAAGNHDAASASSASAPRDSAVPGSARIADPERGGATTTGGVLDGSGRTVLVTGASGMLGGDVARVLLARGWRVRVFQRGHAPVAEREGVDEVLGSVTDPEDVARALDGVDDVVHLAAKVSFTGAWEEFVRVNVTGTRVLLCQAQNAGVKNVVFVSSPSVAHTGVSIEGAGAEPADPGKARGNYARSKAAAELLALSMDGQRDLKVAAVRPHIVWGPGDTQLVERVADRAAAGRMPNLDHGAAMIDTTYIDNASEGIVRALERIDVVHGRALVLTNGEPRPVGELIARMCRATGSEAPTRSIPGGLARLAGKVIETVWPHLPAKLRTGDGEPPMTEFLAEQLSTAHWFDQRETRELLDWTPSVSLDEGFSRLAAYYQDHPRPNRRTGSVSLDRVEDVADEQRARAEESSVASGEESGNATTDLQSVRTVV